MNRLLQFLPTPAGQLVAVGLLAALAVAAVAWQRSRRAPRLPAEGRTVAAPLPRTFERAISRFEPPAAPVTAELSPVAAVPAAPRVLPLAVGGSRVLGEGVSVPYGRLVACETVLALESGRPGTPVVGIVTEDVWAGGARVVPAGAEVHGVAAADPARERVTADGAWRIVWREAGRAREVRLTGVALERSGGQLDGAAGLPGYVVRRDQGRGARLFGATFLGAATAALEQRQPAGVLGIGVPAATAENAALAGTGAVLKAHAEDLRAALAKDGASLRVPAGRPFYLYVTQTIDGAAPAGRLPGAMPSQP